MFKGEKRRVLIWKIKIWLWRIGTIKTDGLPEGSRPLPQAPFKNKPRKIPFCPADILPFLQRARNKEKIYNGWLAQLVRASALQAGGHKFESYITHHLQTSTKV